MCVVGRNGAVSTFVLCTSRAGPMLISVGALNSMPFVRSAATPQRSGEGGCKWILSPNTTEVLMYRPKHFPYNRVAQSPSALLLTQNLEQEQMCSRHETTVAGRVWLPGWQLLGCLANKHVVRRPVHHAGESQTRPLAICLMHIVSRCKIA